MCLLVETLSLSSSSSLLLFRVVVVVVVVVVVCARARFASLLSKLQIPRSIFF